jgi:hypothetical protein
MSRVWSIMLVWAIIGMTISLCARRSSARIEKFEEDDMYRNESMEIMKHCEFSLHCCPSTYSNERGCMCVSPDTRRVYGTRGFNSVGDDEIAPYVSSATSKCGSLTDSLSP